MYSPSLAQAYDASSNFIYLWILQGSFARLLICLSYTKSFCSPSIHPLYEIGCFSVISLPYLLNHLSFDWLPLTNRRFEWLPC